VRDRSPQTLWETALGQLELQVTRPNFETWLRNTTGLRLDGDCLVVGVPTDFALEWLRSRMSPLINRTVSQLTGSTTSVAFAVLGAQPAVAAPSTNGRHPQPAVVTPPADLNPRLTFESFTVVKSNRLAYRAARKVASGRSDFNPLVLSGEPGLGKTHLLHGIGHQALRQGKRVVLLTGEAFVDRFVRTLRAGEPAAFRALFDDCDLLLLDDAQFLASRKASQEQFFHIFNSLHGLGSSVVLTLDNDPSGVAGLSARLASRLMAGLTVALLPPPSSERLEILQVKASHLRRPLSASILRLVADQAYKSVRELEGALNRVAAYADLSNSPLSPDQARQALHPLVAESEQPSAELIVQVVCRYFHIAPDQIAGPTRARGITYARHIAMYLLHERASCSLSQIGQLLGHRDHTTVLSGCRRIEGERTTFPQTRAALAEIDVLLSEHPAA
jgi:chromosomal replication initiator protein